METESPKSICILLVDDHTDSLTMLTMLLTRHGYGVYQASTVEEATRMAAREHCDLLVSDVGLPDGTGHELMRQLKKQYGLKGIAVTGHVYPQDKQDAADAGFERVFGKPLSFPDLLAAIKELTEAS
jgi:CheY-like chemotaxis protein